MSGKEIEEIYQTIERTVIMEPLQGEGSETPR